MMKKVYEISGMTCAGCAGVVKNVLSNVEGVSQVEVNLEKNEAQVEADESVTTEALAEALEKTPYKVVSSI